MDFDLLCLARCIAFSSLSLCSPFVVVAFALSFLVCFSFPSPSRSRALPLLVFRLFSPISPLVFAFACPSRPSMSPLVFLHLSLASPLFPPCLSTLSSLPFLSSQHLRSFVLQRGNLRNNGSSSFVELPLPSNFMLFLRFVYLRSLFVRAVPGCAGGRGRRPSAGLALHLELRALPRLATAVGRGQGRCVVPDSNLGHQTAYNFRCFCCPCFEFGTAQASTTSCSRASTVRYS